jgi:hypothetical protein
MPYPIPAVVRRCRQVLPLLALVTACQPLPHPFADDKPPAALLEIHDTAGVTVAPLVGEPDAVAKKLGAAVAKALVKRDIPASDKTANLDSYQLYGRIVESLPRDDRSALTALWWLYDAKGRVVGKRSAQVEAATHDWHTANDAPIEQLAAISADQLIPLLEDKVPTPTPLPREAERARIAIDAVRGAPGDGVKSLAAAVAAVLRQQDFAIAEDTAKADLRLQCDVSVSQAASGQQHVKIVWHVRRADGTEIGTVGQENDVAKGALDGPWGDTAYNIAIAAGDGLSQLVRRGTEVAGAAQAASPAQAASHQQ